MAGLLDAVTSFVLDQVGNSGEDGGKTASTTDINSNILNSLPTFGGGTGELSQTESLRPVR